MCEITSMTTCAMLRRELEERMHIATCQFGLYYRSKPLVDEYTLASYGIGKDSTLEVKMRLRGGAGEATALVAREMGLLPRYFRTLSTTHARPHGAWKDLFANARDGGASEVKITLGSANGMQVLLMAENGHGPLCGGVGAHVPTLQTLLQMLDLGYSAHANLSSKIGEAGQGAKSGPLGVAKDIVIATAGVDSYATLSRCSRPRCTRS
eukprot:2024931-Prymnesium_polylepis.2